MDVETGKNRTVNVPFTDAIKKTIKLSLPNIGSMVVLHLSNFSTIQCFAKTGRSDEVGQVGLGGFFFSMFGLAIALGLSGALDSLVSQAIGKKEPAVASMSLAQARLVTLTAAIPCGVILMFTEPLLVLIDQAKFAQGAGTYIRWQIVGLLPLFWYSALGCFLRASNRTTAPLRANIVGTLVHVTLSVVLLGVYKHGVAVAGIIAAAAHYVRWMILEAYIFTLPEDERSIASLTAFFKIVADRTQFTRLANGMWVFVKLALPSTLMMWSEWFAYEAQTLIAGKANPNYVPANIELGTAGALAFMIPVGLSQTASYLVGSSLGEGEAANAKTFVRASLSIAIAAMSILSVAMHFGRDILIGSKPDREDKKDDEAYNESMVSYNQMISAFPMLCAFVWIDGLQNVLESIIRGMRLQAGAVWIKVVAMFGIRLGLGSLFCLHFNLGLFYLWLAAAIAMLFSSSIFAYSIYKVDYEAKADEAQRETLKAKTAACIDENEETSGNTPVSVGKITTDDDNIVYN